MRREVYTYPKSAFLSTEKDMNIIVNMIMKNDRLKKMLYYTTRDCINKPSLTEDETLELFGKNIKIVPKLYVDNVVEFDIICHFDQWQMKDFELRPYKIAAEIDSMFNDKHLTGIGKLEFLGANQIILTDEYAGVCLLYRAVHGEEDKKHMPNSNDEQAFIENFDAIFNDK